MFHASLLTPYQETETHGPNFPKPPPDLIEGEEQHEIDGIIGHRIRGCGYQYLVKWKGYLSADNTWEPERNLEGSKETLIAYKCRNKIPT